MASWDAVRRYIQSNFRINSDQGERLALEFRTGENRSQLIFLTRVHMNDTEEWIIVETPFADVGQVDLLHLMRTLEGRVCSGVGTIMGGKTLVLRHTIPIENLDLNELMRPMGLLTNLGDAYEYDISDGGDRF